MKEATPKDGAVATVQQENARRLRKWTLTHCSVCTRYIWFNPIHYIESQEVPEPRFSWTLCKSCSQALRAEMSRSPIRSPLRLRIAIGMIAAERWPMAYHAPSRENISDRRWIIFMAVGFIIAMILHLALIVMIAGIR
ncbi:MAG TPA: hypothetical protein VFU49_14480 [Ktedonobacteraceae bacterium]|nr:hypothetical protein [Ktedonobacteraceae bacterium]